ncbi:MAG: flagellar biosynthesis protein FlhA [Nitrospirae bacterium]|nr:flagellar biosynthesis protein FlhA [Nitrospirota bacterium]
MATPVPAPSLPGIMTPKWITRNSDIILSLFVVGSISVLMIPLPAPVLDVLLTINITTALLILLVTMYTFKPLEFSVFPTLLLMTTLFRLSLNVASTRRILLYGDQGLDAAGTVIMAFGQYVVGGSYIVGIVIFIILNVINFAVITKGSGRIAEVAARFTLDSMPGKQMAIDADLNAGLINEQEAKDRRKEIQQEADFYGAMDGASKFVRGDAVAGAIITVVNLIAGLIIGVVMKGMDIMLALQTYTILTVGDGLVAIIPSFLISVGSGLIVSRTVGARDLAGELAKQMFSYPRALSIAAGFLFTAGAIPGLPTIPFVLMGALTGLSAYITFQTDRRTLSKEADEKKKAARPEGPEKVEKLLALDMIELEVGYGLIPLVDAGQNGELLDRIKGIRRQFALEMGIVVPPVHIRDNLQLKPHEYTILVKGIEVARDQVQLKSFLAMAPPGVKGEIEGTKTKDPAFGMTAYWINENQKEKAIMAGYMVVDVPTVVATHLTEVIRAHAHELLGRQEVQNLLDNLAQKFPKVVEEVVPKVVTLGDVHKVLQNLVREQISIRDLLTVIETLGDHPNVKDPYALTEGVRQALKRVISKQFATKGVLKVITLEPKLEEYLTATIQRAEGQSTMSIEPQVAQKLLLVLQKQVEKLMSTEYHPVLLVAPLIRRHLKNLTEPFMPHLVVLSYGEIEPKVKLENLVTIRMDDLQKTDLRAPS